MFTVIPCLPLQFVSKINRRKVSLCLRTDPSGYIGGMDMKQHTSHIDREKVGPTLQSYLPMKENILIYTEEERCGHSATEEKYTACIGNSFVFIPLCRCTTVYPNTLNIPHLSV
jgi:hypothetical protein